MILNFTAEQVSITTSKIGNFHENFYGMGLNDPARDPAKDPEKKSCRNSELILNFTTKQVSTTTLKI